MKKLILAVTLALVGCGFDNPLIRTERIVAPIPTELLTPLPYQAPLTAAEKKSPSKVAAWLIATEERMAELEKRLAAIRKLYLKELEAKP